MRKQLCMLALSGLLVFGISAGAAYAQDSSMQQPGDAPPGHRGGPWGNPDEQLAHMTKRYSLTADQQAQIKPILEATRQQMEQLRADTSTSWQDKRPRMQSIHEDSTQKIEAILTPDQKAKFEKDQARMQEHREHMHDGPPEGAPPA